ncbi:hypothetical protein [Klebsiella pneumoniae]|uniref:hypothetical protein n=1 Tax=Klebsiella pneumoniae TaxID=573 RepID=UPI001D1982D8|nr:hypothetical protein [Klebsiella pneumoniae]
MTKSTITREQLEEWVAQFDEDGGCDATDRQLEALIRQSLAAMDQKPALHRYRRKAVEPYGPYPWHYEVFVDYPQPFEDIEDEYFYAAPPVVTGFAVDGESGYLPLDYLQGHKDGLEWAAQLAEANHPETGDWLYDDPIELAKAIRKGPDMPPAQPVADSEPVIVVGDDGGDALSYRRLIQSFEPGTKLYLHAQSVPVVSADLLHTAASAIEDLLTTKDRTGACVWFDLPFRLRSAANAHSAPVVPDDVLAALQKVARIRLDLNDFDGDRRGIADCLGDAEEALIEVVNRRAAMLAAATQEVK